MALYDPPGRASLLASRRTLQPRLWQECILSSVHNTAKNRAKLTSRVYHLYAGIEQDTIQRVQASKSQIWILYRQGGRIRQAD